MQAHAQIALRRRHRRTLGRVHRPARPQSADCHRATGQALDARCDAARRGAPPRLRRGPANAAATIAIHGRLGQLHAARGDYARAIDAPRAGASRSRRRPTARGGRRAAARTTSAAPTWRTTSRCSGSPRSPTARELARDRARLRLTAIAERGARAARGRLRREPARRDRSNDARQRRAGTARRPHGEGFDPARARRAAPRARRRRRRASATRSLAQDAALSAALEIRGDRRSAVARRSVRRARRRVRAAAVEPTRGIAAHAPSRARRSDTRIANDSLYRWEWQARPRVARARQRSGRRCVPTRPRSTRSATRPSAGRDLAARLSERRAAALRGVRGFDARADARPSRQRMQPQRCAKCSATLEQLRIAEVRNYFENQCAVPAVFDPSPAERRRARDLSDAVRRSR